MSMLCDAARSTLVIIDLQQRLMPAIHEGELVVKNALALARAARMLEIPIVGTAQYPEGLGPNVPEVHSLCDKVIAKTDFDACAEPDLLAALSGARDDLIVLGCEAHVCVLQTVLGLRSRGHKVRVVADAVGSRAPFNKAMALERMQGAGVKLVTTEMVVFEWMGNARHPQFKHLQALIK
jgi:nicotinamidase-related amidase